MLKAKSYLDGSTTSKKRLSRREQMESSMRLTGSLEFQTVNRHRVADSAEKPALNGSLPLRSTFRRTGGQVTKSLKLDDESRMHLIDDHANKEVVI